MESVDITELSDNKTITKYGELLKSSIIYGANASGKSNLIKALGFMVAFVLSSSKQTQVGDVINVDSFKLNTYYENKPSFFEIIFILNGLKYRYGFEVDNQRIHSEWLFQTNKTTTYLFKRTKDEITINRKFTEGKGLEKRTRPNALFLSVVSQFNGAISTQISNWFNGILVLSGLEEHNYRHFILNALADPEKKSRILKTINSIDLGIEDLKENKYKVNEQSLDKRLPKEIQDFILNNNKDGVAWNINTIHKKYNKSLKFDSFVNFDLENNESDGTKKMIFLTTIILDIIKDSKILVMDELDSRLHQNLTDIIIKLFNKAIKSNSQLIFATHNLNLLTNKTFRRDQIWFVDKDKYGSSSLFSLSDIKVRKDASYSKDYKSGKYGGIPYIDEDTLSKSLFNV
jgi:hypothetical protein